MIVSRLHQFYTQWLPRLADECILCQQSSPSLLCLPCNLGLPWIASSCRTCGLPLANTQSVCGQCLKQPPSFGDTYIPWSYTYPLNTLINRFKNGELVSGKQLSQLFIENLRQGSSPLPDCICPIPLHWRRQMRRGFNQSAYLATQFGNALQIPVLPMVKRIRPTPKQQHLKRKQRLQNLRQAFALNSKYVSFVEGKSIALVDDVVTTQATVETVAKLLQSAGAGKVVVWALARTPQPGVNSSR